LSTEHRQHSALASVLPPYNEYDDICALGPCLTTNSLLDVIVVMAPPKHFSPKFRPVFEAMLELHKNQDKFSVTELKAELLRKGVQDVDLLAYELNDASATTHDALKHAEEISKRAHKHALHPLVDELGAWIQNGAGLEVLDEWAEKFHAWRSEEETVTRADEQPEEIDSFLNSEAPTFDWLVPGVLERKERMILTGDEGAGKSTLLSQMAIQLAAGIHPFTGQQIEPTTVLVVDCENSRKELERRFYALRLKAGDRLQPGRLWVVSFPAGLDLHDIADRNFLDHAVATTQANLLIAGPLYKLANGDPDKEESVKPVTNALDQIRERHECSIVLEAHLPNDRQAAKGRPIGSSLWRRWPELGVELQMEGGLRRWRPPRHETPDLPPALVKGGEWPFTIATRDRDKLWARIAEFAQGRLNRPSLRDLELGLGGADAKASKSSIERAIQEHEDEWDRLFDS
jgi:hypothetical protein